MNLPRRAAWGVLLGALGGLCTALLPARAQAHDFKVGDIVIDHPYATPSGASGASGATGAPAAVYFRALKNTGTQPDELLSASTPAAGAVEIHRMSLTANNVMQMRAQPALPLPAGAEVSLRHGGEWHLMLMNLKQPLQVGDRLSLTLRFARAGSREVTVWVQKPRDDPQEKSSAPHHH